MIDDKDEYMMRGNVNIGTKCLIYGRNALHITHKIIKFDSIPSNKHFNETDCPFIYRYLVGVSMSHTRNTRQITTNTRKVVNNVTNFKCVCIGWLAVEVSLCVCCKPF